MSVLWPLSDMWAWWIRDEAVADLPFVPNSDMDQHADNDNLRQQFTVVDDYLLMTELETEVWCPRCRVYYGKVLRVETDHGWQHVSEPLQIPKYCSTCEQPTERK